MKFDLLEQLCAIHAPSGDESLMKEFLLNYISKNAKNWKVQPEVFDNDEFGDSFILKFGNPKTAVFTHIDSIGFQVKYGKELIKIGGPRTVSGYRLKGTDSYGDLNCMLSVKKDKSIHYKGSRLIDSGTTLTFESNFRETETFIQNCYLDNRLGNFVALKLAETLENGLICFSTYEEHGGGNAEFLGKFIYEKFAVRQALICDITWVTPGVKHGLGVAISIRDSGIPRRKFVNKIIGLAQQSQIPFQIEVESAGGSDGISLQKSSYPFDWCFIGAPEDFVHSPDEKVHKADVASMLHMYQYIMKFL
jgi:putative aminopeptidase FrvX